MNPNRRWQRGGATLVGALALVACDPGETPDARTPSPPAVAAESTLSPEVHSRIVEIGRAALEEGPLVGLSIGIARRGELVFAEGFGQLSVNGPAASGRTTYNMASTGKLFTAAAILRLVDEGRLSLDALLEDLLPEAPANLHGQGITVRHLLSMTSGLNDYTQADLERMETSDAPLEAEFAWNHLRDRPLDFEPGSHWIYSNTGFYLAGLIVERASGIPWGEFVVDSVARPLGLGDIHLCDDAAPERAAGHVYADGTFGPSPFDTERGVRGDGGLCGSVSDLALFPYRLRTGGVISGQAFEQMSSPTRLSNGLVVDYGLGLARGELGGEALWGHLGGVGSLVSALFHYPESESTISVLVNTRGGAIGALVLEGRVAPALLGIDSTLAEVPLTRDSAEQWTGLYRGGRSATEFVMSFDGSRLRRERVGGSADPLPLPYYGGPSFGLPDWPLDRLVFQVASSGATAVSAYYNGIFDGFYVRVPMRSAP